MSDKIASFELNLSNLELNIAERLENEIFEKINIEAQKNIKSIVKQEIDNFDFNNEIKNLVNEKVTDILHEFLNTNTDDNNLASTIYGIFAERIANEANSAAIEIQKSLKNALENSKIELCPKMQTDDILLKEIIYQNGIDIYFDKNIISIFEGEPEDMTMSRNLNDVLKITDVIKKAYECGKNGKDLYIQQIKENGDA